jgi:hypothetical protein
MELQQMISDTQETSQRLYEIIEPWDGCQLVAHLAAVVGRVSDDVMTIEGKLAYPIENVHLARNLADVLIQTIRLSNLYHVDLEQAWIALLEEARMGLSNEELVTRMRDTIRQNQASDTYHGK